MKEMARTAHRAAKPTPPARTAARKTAAPASCRPRQAFRHTGAAAPRTAVGTHAQPYTKQGKEARERQTDTYRR